MARFLDVFYKFNDLRTTLRLKSNLTLFAATFCLLLLPLTAIAGGATSGGGDDVGIEVKQVLGIVTDMIKSDHTLLTKQIKAKLLAKAASIKKIIVVNHNLPVETAVGTQNGEAFSRSNRQFSIMKIVRQRWLQDDAPYRQETLIFHELAVMAGIETTGDYHLSIQFQKEREAFWEHMLANGVACTVSLFTQKKNPFDNSLEPGEYIISSGFVMNSTTSVRGGFVNIKHLSSNDRLQNKSVIFRYITSGTGYLRGMFSDATIVNAATSDAFFTSVWNNSNEITYFTPYDLIAGSRQPIFRKWSKYFTMVSCAKL